MLVFFFRTRQINNPALVIRLLERLAGVRAAIAEVLLSAGFEIPSLVAAAFSEDHERCTVSLSLLPFAAAPSRATRLSPCPHSDRRKIRGGALCPPWSRERGASSGWR